MCFFLRPKLQLALLLCCALIALSGTDRSQKPFEIRIIQHDQYQPIENNSVALDRQPFAIEITLNNVEGVYLNAALGRNYFDLEANDTIPDLQWIGPKCRAEHKFNSERLQFLHDEYISYLFYDPEMDWHRLDPNMQIHGSKVIATKTIEQFCIQEPDRYLPVTEVDFDVFLFFVAIEKPEQYGEMPEELGRFKVQLSWKSD